MWLESLRAAAPEETFALASDVSDPETVNVALVRGVDPGDLYRYPNLGLIQCLWAGVDKLIDDPAVPAHIPLARTVDPAMADQMAATVLAHVLDVALNHHQYRAHQTTAQWEPRHAKALHTKTVAILGFGALGKRCAEYLAFVGAQVIGVRSDRSSAADHHPWNTTSNLMDAVGGADILVNLLPLTADTSGALNAELFALCKPGAALINVGRGQHVVDADLLAALNSGQIRRAVLDVFHVEPLVSSHAFWSHPNVTITPHVAAETDPHTAAIVIAANIRAYRAGNFAHMSGLVDRNRGY
jgi:glyoxylate/hydroxypyruvate reductase